MVRLSSWAVCVSNDAHLVLCDPVVGLDDPDVERAKYLLDKVSIFL